MESGGNWGDRAESARPLFERLTDEGHHEPREPVARRTHDLAALRESIRAELVRLLGTRCPLPSAAVGADRSIWNYGLTDLLEGGKRSLTADAVYIEGVIARTVRAYEPRLREIVVRVGREPAPCGKLEIAIEALLATTRVRVPVAFRFEADVRGATVSSHEHGDE